MKTFFAFAIILAIGCNRATKYSPEDSYVLYLKNASEQIKNDDIGFITDSTKSFEMFNRYLDDKASGKKYVDTISNIAIDNLENSFANADDSIQCKIRRAYGNMLADFLTKKYGYDFDATFPIQYNYGKILSVTYKYGGYNRIIQNSATTIIISSLYFKRPNRADEIYGNYFNKMKAIGYKGMEFRYPSANN